MGSAGFLSCRALDSSDFGVFGIEKIPLLAFKVQTGL